MSACVAVAKQLWISISSASEAGAGKHRPSIPLTEPHNANQEIELPEQTFETIGPGALISSTRFDEIGLNDIDDTFRIPTQNGVLLVSVSMRTFFPAELIAQQSYWGITACVAVGGDLNLTGDVITLGMSSGSHAYNDEMTELGWQRSDLQQEMDAEALRLFLNNEVDLQFSADLERMDLLRVILDDFYPTVDNVGAYDLDQFVMRLSQIGGSAGSDFGDRVTQLVEAFAEIIEGWHQPIYWTETNDQAYREIQLIDTWSSFDFMVTDPNLGYADLFVIGTTWVDTLDLSDADFSLPYSVTVTAAVNEVPDPGTEGEDTLLGDGRDNLLQGYGGRDLLSGLGGSDTLRGGNGADQIWGGAGADAHYGGDDAGVDYARYDDANYGNLVIRLDAPGSNTGAAAGDTYNGIEGLVGGSGNDTVVGNALANYLFGSGGADLVYGGVGNDYLSGDAGGDNLWGGAGADAHYGGNDAGIDYARYDDANYGNLTIRLDAPNLNTGAAAGDTYSGIEGLVGGSGNDVVVGNTLNNFLFGSGGIDQVYGHSGNDYLSGDAGGDNLWGGTGADAHYGGNDAGVDYARYDDANHGNLTLRLDNASLNGGAAAVGDTYTAIEGLVGGAGADVIIGNAAANWLFGSGGADYIDGLSGNDYLNGGAGADRFRFSTALGANNVDQIADFQHLVDDILLVQSIFAGIGAALTADEFRIGMAVDANDRILYNNTTGQIFYDSNANVAGGMMLFATVTAGTVLTFNDFVMV